MTAVEFLLEQLENYDSELPYYNSEAIIQAKEMEKKQMIDAHIEGQRVFDKHPHTQWTNDQAEQYYTSTYGSKGSDVMTPENHIGVLSEAVKKETTSSQTEISNSTITDQIDGIIFELPFDDKIKLWKLIEKLIEENRTEISDEEIGKGCDENIPLDEADMWSERLYFRIGAKWYREQLKQR